MPESKKYSFQPIRLPDSHMMRYDATRDASHLATILIFDNYFYPPSRTERQSLNLNKYRYPDPPAPEGADDIISIQRAQRYELDVSEAGVIYSANVFPRVLLYVLSHPEKLDDKVKQQSKWLWASPHDPKKILDPKTMRISRDAGGVEDIPGVRRYSFADIVPAGLEEKKIIEAAMPSTLAKMHDLEEYVYQEWLKIPNIGKTIFRDNIEKCIYERVYAQVFHQNLPLYGRPARAVGRAPSPELS